MFWKAPTISHACFIDLYIYTAVHIKDFCIMHMNCLDIVAMCFVSNTKTVQSQKSVQPPRKVLWKKMWNSKWRPRNSCDGRLKAKILIFNKNSSEFVEVKCGEGDTKFTWIVVIKIFAFSLPSQPFIGCHFGFHIFFHNSIPGCRTLFIQLGCLDLTFFVTACCKVGKLHAYCYLFYSL